MDSQQRITSFHEKTRGAYLNAGIYAFDNVFLEHIPDRTPCSLEYDLFPAMLGEGIHAFVSHAPLHDIGTPARLDAFRTWTATVTGNPLERAARC